MGPSGQARRKGASDVERVLMIAMRVSRYPVVVPTIAVGLDTVPPASSCFVETFPPFDLYKVRREEGYADVSKPESAIAPFLTELQARVKKEGIRVGSCEPTFRLELTLDPYLYSGVHVSLIGHDQDRLRELEQEVVKELDGKVISEGRLGDDSAKI